MRNEEIIERLEGEVLRITDEMSNVNPEDDKYGLLLKQLTELNNNLDNVKKTTIKMVEIDLDERKANTESEVRMRITEIENAFKRDELTIKRKEGIRNDVLNTVKIGVEITAIVAPLISYNIWMDKGFKFEETGVLTSTTFKGFISKMKAGK